MKIKLNDTARIDLDKLIESRLLIQANSGGGKSYTTRRIIEQAFGNVQIIVIDPEGEFGNMRAKYDFVYCGKDGDAPAEPRSASLLARRLLELKASAIIDLYEIPNDRKRFVKLFLEALINAPKELWHDVIVIIDECHIFAPEKSESEALSSVIDLASRGRKRGYCLIAATQRPAKLHKDVSAECNNKLIGRAVQDIDRKRSAEEIGFSSKEEVLSLRDLEPGEFYAFGPAISRDVTKIKIGSVSVPPAKRGAAKKAPPKPSAKVKQILSQLSDLPQEAQKEATTIAELKKENAELKRLKAAGVTPQKEEEIQNKWYELGFEAGKVAQKKETAAMIQEFKLFQKRVEKDFVTILKISSGYQEFQAIDRKYFEPVETTTRHIPRPIPKESEFTLPDRIKVPAPVLAAAKENSNGFAAPGELPEGERKVLTASAQYGDDGISREGITTITGFKRSTRDAYIARLYKKGMVEARNGGKIVTTIEGKVALGDNFQPLPTGQALRDHLMQTLPEGEKKVLSVVIGVRVDGSTEFVPRDYIEQETGFKRSTRDAYIARLANRQLVETSSEGVRGVDMLFTDL